MANKHTAIPSDINPEQYRITKPVEGIELSSGLHLADVVFIGVEPQLLDVESVQNVDMNEFGAQIAIEAVPVLCLDASNQAGERTQDRPNKFVASLMALGLTAGAALIDTPHAAAATTKKTVTSTTKKKTTTTKKSSDTRKIAGSETITQSQQFFEYQTIF